MTESWHQRVKRVALDELDRRGWKLVVDPASFVAQICGEMGERGEGEPDAPDRDARTAAACVAIKRATVRNYCRLLHAACGETGSRRQSLAYRELWQYLFPVALAKTHREDLAQDLTQQTLIKLWASRDRCREPEALLGLATTILVNSWCDTCRRDRVIERAGAEPLAWSELDYADEAGATNRMPIFSQRMATVRSTPSSEAKPSKSSQAPSPGLSPTRICVRWFSRSVCTTGRTTRWPGNSPCRSAMCACSSTGRWPSCGPRRHWRRSSRMAPACAERGHAEQRTSPPTPARDAGICDPRLDSDPGIERDAGTSPPRLANSDQAASPSPRRGEKVGVRGNGPLATRDPHPPLSLAQNGAGRGLG